MAGLGKTTYSALIAVNEKGVIFLVMHHLENGSHGTDRNGFFLGARHCDMTVLNAVDLHERHKGFRDVFVDECADAQWSVYFVVVMTRTLQCMGYTVSSQGGWEIGGQTHMIVFSPSFWRKG